MLGRSAGLLAASALGASALVLPIPHHVERPSSESKRTTVRVPCASCTLPTIDVAHGERPQDVQLDFAISDDGKGLLLNGKPFFRAFSNWNSAPLAIDAADDVWVSQVDSHHDRPSPIPMHVTDSSLVVKSPRPVSLSGDALIPLHWTITELENEAITIDDVKITLLQTSDGELFIMPVPAVSAPPPALQPLIVYTSRVEASEPRPEQPCSHLPESLCRFREMVASKMDSLAPSAGCHGRRPSHGAMPMTRPAPGNAHAHHRHPHPRPHHSLAQRVFRLVLSILVPTLVGVAIGLAASSIAVLFFRACVFVAFKFSRRRPVAPPAPCSYSDIKHVIVDEIDDDSDVEAPPPQYEDAPAYEKAENLA